MTESIKFGIITKGQAGLCLHRIGRPTKMTDCDRRQHKQHAKVSREHPHEALADITTLASWHSHKHGNIATTLNQSFCSRIFNFQQDCVCQLH